MRRPTCAIGLSWDKSVVLSLINSLEAAEVPIFVLPLETGVQCLEFSSSVTLGKIEYFSKVSKSPAIFL
jgi:hypothetical protein